MLKNFSITLRVFFFSALMVGVLYPLFIVGLAEILAPDGALKDASGQMRGSAFIGQEFASDKYLWPRPSTSGYDTTPGSASNYGPISLQLKKAVEVRKAQGFAGEMLFSSGSGLDPHISLNSANLQVARIAKARGRKETDITTLIAESVEQPTWGFLGEIRVNVLAFNLKLDQMYPAKP